MSQELKFNCPLPNGVHARPASALEEVTSCFRADITLINDRTGASANAKSVLAIVGADIRPDDHCRLIATGPDERDAIAALSTFIADEFPACDEALPPVSPQEPSALPLPLRQVSETIRRGTPVITGVGRGRVVQVLRLRVPESIPLNAQTDFATEVRKLDTALSNLAASYEERLTRHATGLELAVIKAHRSIARDPEFRVRLHEALRTKNRTAAGAVAEAEAHFTQMLLGSESTLLRERALDLQDVCAQLLRQIYGKAALESDLRLTEDSVVVAESLTPGQFLRLDRNYLKGLVLAHAGTTSHTIILARSFGTPTLTNVPDLIASQLDGSEVVVDADAGILVTQLTDAVRRYYRTEEQRVLERRARERRFATQPGATQDGQRIEIAANISSAEEAAAAFEAGAESIGLFRTEMLFLERETAPDENEQFEIYRQVLTAAGGRTVIIRTLDIGGDKPLSYLNLPAEDNPFLGYRAVRVYSDFPELLRTQLRALIRASAHGRLKLLLPMVTSVSEVRWVKRILREEQAHCEAASVPFDVALPVGAMIEVPAAAFCLDQLSQELDFFSIGTNDLLQCFAAADRTNPRVAHVYDPLQPAFLRLLKKIVHDVHLRGKWIGLCGEMGAQTRCLPLLIGLGLEEISVAPSAIPGLKAEIFSWSAAACRKLLSRAITCATADDVGRLVEEFATKHAAPLIDQEMILIESNSTSKEEAIKEVVDRLYVIGRTERPRLVEQAVWQREAVYSTGFGHGFAIPHCKTDAVTANSLVILKLREPVTWGSLDGHPVSVLLFLTIRETDRVNGHMKVFSRLARQVMHEDFRNQLSRETDPAALCSYLNATLSS